MGASDMTAREAATQYRMSQWAEIMRERAESGESITKFCENRGIKLDQFFYWQRKLRQAASEHFERTQKTRTTSLSVPGFAQVSLETTPLQAALPQTSDTADTLHVEIGGVRIIAGVGYPPDKLAALLRGLSQC